MLTETCTVPTALHFSCDVDNTLHKFLLVNGGLVVRAPSGPPARALQPSTVLRWRSWEVQPASCNVRFKLFALMRGEGFSR